MWRPFSVITIKEPLSIRSYHIMVCEISQIIVRHSLTICLGQDIVLYYFRRCCIQLNRNNSKSLFHLCKPQSQSYLRHRPAPSFPYYSLIAATSLYRKFLDWKISKGKGKPVLLVRRESSTWDKTMQRSLVKGKSTVVMQPLCTAKHSGECIQEGCVFI